MVRYGMVSLSQKRTCSVVGFLMPATGLFPALGTAFGMKACAFYTNQLLDLQYEIQPYTNNSVSFHPFFMEGKSRYISVILPVDSFIHFP